MRVAVIDVGSNTVRLLVATLENGSVEPVREERTAVGLAREIERTGRIPDEKIARAAEVARRYARDAAKLGADVMTAPPAVGAPVPARPVRRQPARPVRGALTARSVLRAA